MITKLNQRARAAVLLLVAVLVLALAGVAGAQYLSQGWDGIRIGNPQVLTSGTTMKVVELHNVVFAGDSSKTATTAIDGTGTWYAATGWKTNSANAEAKIGISGTTMTVTPSAATTGTCSVMLIQGG